MGSAFSNHTCISAFDGDNGVHASDQEDSSYDCEVAAINEKLSADIQSQTSWINYNNSYNCLNQQSNKVVEAKHQSITLHAEVGSNLKPDNECKGSQHCGEQGWVQLWDQFNVHSELFKAQSHFCLGY